MLPSNVPCNRSVCYHHYLNQYINNKACLSHPLTHYTHYKKVIIADEAEAAAETTALLASEHSGTFGHAAFHTDITDVRSVLDLFSFVKQQYGCLDYAVNCAAIEGTRAPIHDTSLEHFDAVCDVNLRGTYLCMREELQLMLQSIAARGPLLRPTPLATTSNSIDELELKAASSEFQPAIVNVASTAGMGPCPEFAPYAATKAAIISLTQSAAIEYAGHIRINAICPATTYTPMYQRFAEQWPDWQAATNAQYAVGRIATAEEVARAIVWMLGRDCSFMTGSTLRVDGGYVVCVVCVFIALGTVSHTHAHRQGFEPPRGGRWLHEDSRVDKGSSHDGFSTRGRNPMAPRAAMLRPPMRPSVAGVRTPYRAMLRTVF